MGLGLSFTLAFIMARNSSLAFWGLFGVVCFAMIANLAIYWHTIMQHYMFIDESGEANLTTKPALCKHNA
jgi:hypothetical protein